MIPFRLTWGLVPIIFMWACTKTEKTSKDSIWSDDIQTIEFLLSGPEDLCDEIKTFSYTMSGSRLTPRRVTLFKTLAGGVAYDKSLCRQSYAEYERASFIVNPGTENAIQYASMRDACLYSPNASVKVLILPEEDLARVVQEIKPKRYGNSSFSRNETDVFWNREYDFENGPYGVSLEGANPLTFQVVKEPYGKDDKSVWIESRKVVDADPATFSVGSGNWSYDAWRVYYLGLALPSADPGSFQSVLDPYSKDKTSIYFKNQKIERVDPASFRAFDWGAYSHDANSVVYDGMIVEGADVKTFVGRFDAIGTDATAVYAMGKKLDISRATYTEMGPYLKDTSKVYYYDELMEGADAATFEYKQCVGFTGPMKLACIGSSSFVCYAQDKNFKYKNGKKLPPDQTWFPD